MKEERTVARIIWGIKARTGKDGKDRKYRLKGHICLRGTAPASEASRC